MGGLSAAKLGFDDRNRGYGFDAPLRCYCITHFLGVLVFHLHQRKARLASLDGYLAPLDDRKTNET